ncbi:laminin subunit alpha-4 [Sinocyclocheilus grahami]|uniref:laminin subunit alpha-4 n=1 Tax=Sinocyclocheilus grahami TaxID=75366 RepID=UPI0007AD1DF6|nr:PREDICTED: laminin subunit alpha-4 [Sinocyclocheilus grahami]
MASLLFGSICVLCILSALTHTASSQQLNTVYRVCARGFFLSEQETCLPCNCKGHADSCEDITGICIECQHHTFGDFCDQCEDRYLPGFHPDGTFVCRPCACPLSLESNNFATRCDKRGNFLRCVCQEGYAGHYCERCAPGFYGNPMELGNSCKKCDCNGNSDPNLIFNECNNVTGECLNCWGNTSGDNCERCALGFYGDAISAKDCRECQCDKCGTASCDDRTGVCHCKPGVTGHLCDRCEEGYSGFGSCMGCRRCECASAALRATCHPLTHSCQCRPGAGGRYCERCLPGFWDYSPSGCKKCDCPEENCDMHSGECLPEASKISECNINCDACIWSLIGDIRQSNKTLDQVKNSVLNISTGAAANDRLKYYNYTAHRLQDQFLGWRNKYAVMRADTGRLEEETQKLLTDMELVAEELNLKGSDANGHVQKALNALTVYDNIVKNIDDANITALTALNISSSTHDATDVLNSQLNLTRSQSNDIFTEASSLYFKQKDVESAVLDNKKYIEETNDMMESSSKKIAKIISDINAIHKDRTPKRLQFTQEVAEGTLNRSAEVLQMVTPILKRVEEWDSNMKNEAYSATAFERTVLSAGEAVEDLSEIVPELLSKLRVVEEKKPVNNVSTNIMKIRELIAQARSVAKKVQVSMKFNGQSSVEVHPHSNLDELKTVTSISFYIRVDPDKDPIEDRFLLYLGDKQGRKDYMGLAIKNDNLVYVYNLGGEVVEIPLSSKPVSSWPPVFNLVKVERLGRHGKLFLTVPSQDTTAEQKFIQKGEADGTDSLFDLDPKDNVFIVGGVPPDVKVQKSLFSKDNVSNRVKGSDILSEVLFHSLFRGKNKFEMPLQRHKLAFSQSRVTSFLFDGSGFALVNNIERRGKIGIVTRFDIEVRTVANNGILFLMVNEVNMVSLSKTVVVFYLQMSRKVYFTGDGYLGSTAKISPFQSFEGGLNFRTLQSNGLLFYHRDGLDEFSLSVENGAVVLQSKGTRVRSHKKNYNDGRSHFLVASVTNQKYELVIDDKDKQDKKKPSSSSQSDNVPKTFYYGGSSTSSIQNFTGCISYAYISRQDRDIEPEDFQRYSENVQVSLQDCPLERPPAALHNKDSRESSRRSPGHSRKVGRDESSLPHGLKNNPLDAPETEAASCYLSSRPRVTRHAHHYGGFAHSRHEYTGIASVIRDESHFSLSLKTQSAFGLIFYLADESEENFMALFLTHGMLVFTFSSGQNQQYDSFNFGSRLKMVMEVRPRVASGVLLHVFTGEKEYLTLYIYQNQVVVVVNNGIREFSTYVSPRQEVCDGNWHKITVIRDGNVVQLDVDSEVNHVVGPVRETAQNSSAPVFIGGAPASMLPHSLHSKRGYTGCMRNLSVNESPVSFSKAALVSGAVGVGACPAA